MQIRKSFLSWHSNGIALQYPLNKCRNIIHVHKGSILDTCKNFGCIIHVLPLTGNDHGELYFSHAHLPYHLAGKVTNCHRWEMSANTCTSISEFPEPKPDYRPVCFGPTGRPTQCGKSLQRDGPPC